MFVAHDTPLARSSSISKSLWFAFIDRYNAVTEYRFEARIERDPSWELIVFCRLTCGKEEPEEVDALDGVCSIVAAIAAETVDIQSRSAERNLALAVQDVGQRAL